MNRQKELNNTVRRLLLEWQSKYQAGPGLTLGLDDRSWQSWLAVVMRTSTKSVSARRQQTGLGSVWKHTFIVGQN